MSVVVRTVTRFLLPAVVMFGAYVIMHGHVTPGGGFQGGAVIASAVALVVVAFGAQRLRRHKETLAVLEDVGALTFVVLAFLGLGVTFFFNSLAGAGGLFGREIAAPELLPGSHPGGLNTGGMLALMNWAVGLKVLAGLGSIVVLFSLLGGEDDR